jgi:hypothetical protein
MPKPDTSTVLRNIDRRLSSIEQVLPTLPTRDEMQVAISSAIASAIAPLATRDEMRVTVASAIAPLPTREETRHHFEETRRHFDVVAESLRVEIRMIAEGHGNLSYRMDTLERKTTRDIAGLDLRVLRLEAKKVE